MGDKFTEGAIVQHLAKLRIRLEDLARDVPPPLRRGTVTKDQCTVYKPRKGGKPPPKLPAGLVVDKPSVLYDKSSAKPKTTGTVKKECADKVKEEVFWDDEDDDIMEDLYDSDDDYGVKKKKSRKTPKKPTRSAIKPELDLSPTKVKAEAIAKSPSKKPGSNPRNTAVQRKDTVMKNGIIESVEEDEGPVIRARGIKGNYQYPKRGESKPPGTSNAVSSNPTMASASYETSPSKSDSDIPVSPRSKIDNYRQPRLAIQVGPYGLICCHHN